MFKKVSRVMLSMLLFISTAGLTVDKHYCGDHLVSVSFFRDAKSCCGMDGDCCHQVTDTYKLTVDYTHPVFYMTFDRNGDVMPFQAMIYNATMRAGFSSAERSGLSPPPTQHKTLSTLQAYRL
jgi:hypothetical protein